MTTNTHTPEYQLLLKLLKECREAAGVTQVEAAVALGLPQSYVSKTERGERRADLIDLLRFLKIYGAHPDTFIADLLSRLPKDSSLRAAKALKRASATASDRGPSRRVKMSA